MTASQGIPPLPTIGHERCYHPQLIVSYESCFVWHNVRVVEELGNMKFPLKKKKKINILIQLNKCRNMNTRLISTVLALYSLQTCTIVLVDSCYLQERDHFVGAGFQVNSSDSDILP